MKGRAWLKQQMKDCGLDIYEDAALNIHGFLPVKEVLIFETYTREAAYCYR